MAQIIYIVKGAKGEVLYDLIQENSTNKKLKKPTIK